MFLVFFDWVWGKQSSFIDDTDAISKASNSVVKLSCYDKSGDLYATGSGFIMFESNVIVTNYHVIEDNVYSVKAQSESGAEYSIESVLTYSDKRDLAILQINSETELSPLPLGASDSLQKGEKVLAIGSPLGLMNSVSDGVFSGYITDDELKSLQFTAAISSGSSGGALFDSNGKVIGVTYASYVDGQNLNLAIPISDVYDLWDEHNEKDSMTIEEFYNLFEHPISIDEVLSNADYYDGQSVLVAGYISSVFAFYDSSEIGSAWIDYYLVGTENNIIGYSVLGDFEKISASLEYQHYWNAEDERSEEYQALGFEIDNIDNIFMPGDYIELSGKVDNVIYKDSEHGIDWHHVVLRNIKIVE